MDDPHRDSARSEPPVDDPPFPPKGVVDVLRLVGQPWLVTFLVLHGGGWWIYQQQFPIDDFSLLAYTVSATASAAFWILVNLLRDWLDAVSRTALSLVIGVVVMFILVSQYETYVEFGEFMSASMVSYAGKGGISTFAHYIETYLNYPLSVVFYTGAPLMAALWAFGPRLALPEATKRSVAALGTAAVLVITVAGTSLLAHRRHIAIDTSIITASVRTAFMPSDNRLNPNQRQAIPKSPPDGHDRPNIVLILNESFGVHEIDLRNDEVDGLPFVEPWLQKAPKRTVVFERSYANSTSTNVSVPSLMTGVGPERPTSNLNTAPMIWDWAREAGLNPFYVSSQNYYSTQFPEFFFADDSMPVLRPNTYEELGREGDFSVDELFAADKFAEQLREMPDGEPVFAVYNTNAMHKPFQQTSPRLEEQPQRENRYRNALYILDRALKRAIEALERDGRLENTIFIMTSDHGEHHKRRHSLPRILSVYEEFTRVPMVIRVPEDWPRTHGESLRQLRTNGTRNVANVDIVPTVVDALGYTDIAQTADIRDRLSGHSLLDPVPPDRFIYVLNNNAHRHWEHTSFGVFWRDWRFVYSDIQGPQLFDIAEDPHQRRDRWNDAPPRIRRNIVDTIQQNRYLSEIWSSSESAISR